MNEITIDAYAKVNLSLDVLGKLSNGYHEVRMVMQQLKLCDKVTVRKTGRGRREIFITTNVDVCRWITEILPTGQLSLCLDSMRSLTE